MQVHDGPQSSHEETTPHPRWGTPGVPDMHELSAQVAMVKAKTRPWKSIIALVLAIGAGATSGWAHSHFQHFFTGDHWIDQVIAAACAVAFCVFASAATIGLSAKAKDMAEPVAGESHAAIIRYALVLVGAVTTLVVTLALFGIPVGQLVVGGALTSVFVGIAAQQSLSNVFAGLVLLLARPFKVGDSIKLRAGALAGEIGGTVTEVGITYLRLATADGMVSVPNSQVLNAVVGPLPPGTQLPAPPPPVPATAPPATGQPSAPPPPVAVNSPDGSSAGPVGTADGAGGEHRPGSSGEQ